MQLTSAIGRELVEVPSAAGVVMKAAGLPHSGGDVVVEELHHVEQGVLVPLVDVLLDRPEVITAQRNKQALPHRRSERPGDVAVVDALVTERFLQLVELVACGDGGGKRTPRLRRVHRRVGAAPLALGPVLPARIPRWGRHV